MEPEIRVCLTGCLAGCFAVCLVPVLDLVCEREAPEDLADVVRVLFAACELFPVEVFLVVVCFFAAIVLPVS
ncbi:MAG: hypothetical protein II795_02725 [Firmicutes bacterium]|nr:hypothetical protein [Bacillota bacterium]